MSVPQNPSDTPHEPAAGQQPPAYPQSGQDSGSYSSSGSHPQSSYPQSSYPQGGYQQEGYAQGGYQPDGYGAAPVATKRPGTVLGAVICWVLVGLGAAISGIFFAVAASSSDAEREINAGLTAEEQAQLDASGIEPGGLLAALGGFGIAIAVLGVLTLVVAFFLLRGAGWARIVLTILGVLLVLPALVTLVGPLLVIAAIVLQFLPVSNAWFASRKSAPTS